VGYERGGDLAGVQSQSLQRAERDGTAVEQHRAEPGTAQGGTSRRLAEAMECLFPGSWAISRRFSLEVTELEPGTASTVGGVTARAWEADHPSGAPALILRLEVAGKAIAYTGDTAWTDAARRSARGDRPPARDCRGGRAPLPPGRARDCLPLQSGQRGEAGNMMNRERLAPVHCGHR
jgi:hypothetical protein